MVDVPAQIMHIIPSISIPSAGDVALAAQAAATNAAYNYMNSPAGLALADTQREYAKEVAAYAPLSNINPMTLQNTPLSQIAGQYGENVASGVQSYFTANPTQKAIDIATQAWRQGTNIIGSSGIQSYLGETPDKRFTVYSEAGNQSAPFTANILTGYQQSALGDIVTGAIKGIAPITGAAIMGIRGIESLPASIISGGIVSALPQEFVKSQQYMTDVGPGAKAPYVPASAPPVVTAGSMFDFIKNPIGDFFGGFAKSGYSTGAGAINAPQEFKPAYTPVYENLHARPDTYNSSIVFPGTSAEGSVRNAALGIAGAVGNATATGVDFLKSIIPAASAGMAPASSIFPFVSNPKGAGSDIGSPMIGTVPGATIPAQRTPVASYSNAAIQGPVRNPEEALKMGQVERAAELEVEKRPGFNQNAPVGSQQWAENYVELSSEYHNLAQKTGVQQPANPFEYQGDLALAYLKGVNKGSSSSTYGENITNTGILQLPGGLGIQDIAWQRAEAGKGGEQPAVLPGYEHAIMTILNSAGQYGPYAELYGGRPSTTVTTLQPFAFRGETVVPGIASPVAAAGIPTITPPAAATMAAAAAGTVPAAIAAKPASYTSGGEFRIGDIPGGLGSIFAAVPIFGLPLGLGADIVSNITGFANKTLSTDTEPGRFLSYASGGIYKTIDSTIGWIPGMPSFVPASMALKGAGSVAGSPAITGVTTTTTPGGNETTVALGNWLDANRGNVKTPEQAAIYNKNVGLFNAMSKQVPTTTATTTTSTAMSTGPKEYKYGMWDVYSEKAGDVLRGMWGGYSTEQLKAYGTQVQSETAGKTLTAADIALNTATMGLYSAINPVVQERTAGSLRNLVYGTGYTLSTAPLDVLPSIAAGVALWGGGEAIGAVLAPVAAGTGTAAAAARALQGPVGSTLIGGFFAGSMAWGLTEGGKANAEEFWQNVGKAAPSGVATLWGAGLPSMVSGVPSLGGRAVYEEPTKAFVNPIGPSPIETGFPMSQKQYALTSKLGEGEIGLTQFNRWMGYEAAEVPGPVINVPSGMSEAGRFLTGRVTPEASVVAPDIGMQRMQEVYGTTSPNFVETATKGAAHETALERFVQQQQGNMGTSALINALPEVPEGYVRLTHSTRVAPGSTSAKSIQESGIFYNPGFLEGTTDVMGGAGIWKDSLTKYLQSDYREYFGPNVVIADVKWEVYRDWNNPNAINTFDTQPVNTGRHMPGTVSIRANPTIPAITDIVNGELVTRLTGLTPDAHHAVTGPGSVVGIFTKESLLPGEIGIKSVRQVFEERHGVEPVTAVALRGETALVPARSDIATRPASGLTALSEGIGFDLVGKPYLSTASVINMPAASGVYGYLGTGISPVELVTGAEIKSIGSPLRTGEGNEVAYLTALGRVPEETLQKYIERYSLGPISTKEYRIAEAYRLFRKSPKEIAIAFRGDTGEYLGHKVGTTKQAAGYWDLVREQQKVNPDVEYSITMGHSHPGSPNLRTITHPSSRFKSKGVIGGDIAADISVAKYNANFLSVRHPINQQVIGASGGITLYDTSPRKGVIGTRSVRDVYADLFEEWQVANTLAKGTYSGSSITAPYDNHGGMAKHITGEAVPWGTQYWYSPGNPATEYANARNFVKVANRYGMNAKIIEYPTPIPRTYTKEAYRYVEATDTLEPGALMPMFKSQKEANAAFNIGADVRNKAASDFVASQREAANARILTESTVPVSEAAPAIYPQSPIVWESGVAWNTARSEFSSIQNDINVIATGRIPYAQMQTKTRLSWISPKELQERQFEMFRQYPAAKDRTHTGVELYYGAISKDTVAELKGKMLSGEVFSPLSLFYDRFGNIDWTTQEGRHRTEALISLGVEKVPVWETFQAGVETRGGNYALTPEAMKVFNARGKRYAIGERPSSEELYPSPQLIFEGREEGIPVEADHLQLETMKEISKSLVPGEKERFFMFDRMTGEVLASGTGTSSTTIRMGAVRKAYETIPEERRGNLAFYHTHPYSDPITNMNAETKAYIDSAIGSRKMYPSSSDLESIGAMNPPERIAMFAEEGIISHGEHITTWRGQKSQLYPEAMFRGVDIDKVNWIETTMGEPHKFQTRMSIVGLDTQVISGEERTMRMSLNQDFPSKIYFGVPSGYHRVPRGNIGYHSSFEDVLPASESEISSYIQPIKRAATESEILDMIRPRNRVATPSEIRGIIKPHTVPGRITPKTSGDNWTGRITDLHESVFEGEQPKILPTLRDIQKSGLLKYGNPEHALIFNLQSGKLVHDIPGEIGQVRVYDTVEKLPRGPRYGVYHLHNDPPTTFDIAKEGLLGVARGEFQIKTAVLGFIDYITHPKEYIASGGYPSKQDLVASRYWMNEYKSKSGVVEEGVLSSEGISIYSRGRKTRPVEEIYPSHEKMHDAFINSRGIQDDELFSGFSDGRHTVFEFESRTVPGSIVHIPADDLSGVHIEPTSKALMIVEPLRTSRRVELSGDYGPAGTRISKVSSIGGKVEKEAYGIRSGVETGIFDPEAWTANARSSVKQFTDVDININPYSGTVVYGTAKGVTRSGRAGIPEWEGGITVFNLYRTELPPSIAERGVPAPVISPSDITSLYFERGEQAAGAFRTEPGAGKIFQEGQIVTANLETGAVTRESVRAVKETRDINRAFSDFMESETPWSVDLNKYAKRPSTVARVNAAEPSFGINPVGVKDLAGLIGEPVPTVRIKASAREPVPTTRGGSQVQATRGQVASERLQKILGELGRTRPQARARKAASLIKAETEVAQARTRERNQAIFKATEERIAGTAPDYSRTRLSFFSTREEELAANRRTYAGVYVPGPVTMPSTLMSYDEAIFRGIRRNAEAAQATSSREIFGAMEGRPVDRYGQPQTSRERLAVATRMAGTHPAEVTREGRTTTSDRESRIRALSFLGTLGSADAAITSMIGTSQAATTRERVEERAAVRVRQEELPVRSIDTYMSTVLGRESATRSRVDTLTDIATRTETETPKYPQYPKVSIPGLPDIPPGGGGGGALGPQGKFLFSEHLDVRKIRDVFFGGNRRNVNKKKGR